MTYRLSKEQRREVCVHEAAHAVMSAMGGAFVYRLAVAPVGSTEWTCEGRKGGMLVDLWGGCQASDNPGFSYLTWDDSDGCYRANKDLVASLPKEFLRSLRQCVRAEICVLLAGPAASQIFEGNDVSLWEGDFTPAEDITKALGLAQLLHWRNEYDYLADLTERMLRRPEVWAMVLRLADELERHGDMEEFAGFLPEPIPNWPASPRAKNAHDELRLSNK